jgi:hypothetical protein
VFGVVFELVFGVVFEVVFEVVLGVVLEVVFGVGTNALLIPESRAAFKYASRVYVGSIRD